MKPKGDEKSGLLTKTELFNKDPLSKVTVNQKTEKNLIHCLLSEQKHLSNFNLGYFKVIPLKLFYYQTFFETWGN